MMIDWSGAEAFKAFSSNKHFKTEFTVFLPLTVALEIKMCALKLLNMKLIFFNLNAFYT